MLSKFLTVISRHLVFSKKYFFKLMKQNIFLHSLKSKKKKICSSFIFTSDLLVPSFHFLRSDTISLPFSPLFEYFSSSWETICTKKRRGGWKTLYNFWFRETNENEKDKLQETEKPKITGSIFSFSILFLFISLHYRYLRLLFFAHLGSSEDFEEWDGYIFFC